MSARRRKWNSMMHLPEETSTGLSSGPPSPGLLMPESNLKSVSQWSVSNPEISINEPEDEGNGGGENTDWTGTPSSPVMEPTEEFTFTPTPNKSRQRKFYRHFKLEGEELLDYYSCALVEDNIILLQGFLYITRNYFAFYANVFSHIKKVVINVEDIERISKTKTAYVIPNAIDVRTKTEKFLFTSFISRSTAFNQMQRVWQSVKCNERAEVADCEGAGGRDERGPPKVRLSNGGGHTSSPAGSSSDTNSLHDLTPTPTTPRKEVSFVIQEVDSGSPEKRRTSVQTSNTSTLPGSSNSYSCDATKTKVVHGPMSSSVSTWNTNLIRLCYVLTILLAISAVHLYIRVDNLTSQQRLMPRHYYEQHNDIPGEDALQLEAARAMISKINENIQRIRMVSNVLEEFSIRERNLYHEGRESPTKT